MCHVKGIALICLVFCSGCASDVYKVFSLDSNPTTSLSLDARQRVILSTDKGGVTHNSHIVCAEPSPDAIVSIAASGLLNVPIGDKNLLEATARSAETVTRLGSRTQTIQLLRDSLYRACEGYLNGAIDKPQYIEILYMYDDFVVTLLAIQELANLRVTTPLAASGRQATEQTASTTPATQPANPTDTRRPSSPVSTGNSLAIDLLSEPESSPVDVPQAIQAIVFRYLDNQMALYQGIRGEQKQ